MLNSQYLSPLKKLTSITIFNGVAFLLEAIFFANTFFKWYANKCNKRFIHFSYITFQCFATLHNLSLHFASFIHHLFCTDKQEYSLIPYCKTNALLSVSWLLLFLRYNIFCVDIIYKKRHTPKQKLQATPSTSALLQHSIQSYTCINTVSHNK